jgi:predicted nucleotidyltransferase
MFRKQNRRDGDFSEEIQAIVLRGGPSVSPDITARQEALERLCRRYRVARLNLFGSAALGQELAAHSDLDFLVEFKDRRVRMPTRISACSRISNVSLDDRWISWSPLQSRIPTSESRSSARRPCSMQLEAKKYGYPVWPRALARSGVRRAVPRVGSVTAASNRAAMVSNAGV